MIKIKHDKKLFWIIVVLMIILIGVLILIQYQEARKKLENIECQKDSDCVKRQITCCPCNSGGREACLSKNNEDYLNELNTCPDKLVCSQVYNCQETSCKCANNKCQES